jgi:hypothetical protein
MKKSIYVLTLIPFLFSCAKEINSPSKQAITQQAQFVNSTNISDAISLPVQFGVKFGDGTSLTDGIQVLQKLEAPYLRTSESIKNYNGETISWIEKGYSDGIKIMLNINWEDAGSVRQFPRDLTLYEIQLRKLLTKYADKIEVAVCENEPTTDKFWGDDSMTHYMAELQVFAKVCNEFGVKCADGGIHVDNVSLVMNGGKQNKNSPQVKELLDAYKIIPLTYVNFHFKVTASGYPAGKLKTVADWVRNYTGHDVMSNEWHTPAGNLNVLDNMVSQIKEAEYAYAVKWSGGDYDSPLNQGSNLTTYGIDYRDTK